MPWRVCYLELSCQFGTPGSLLRAIVRREILDCAATKLAKSGGQEPRLASCRLRCLPTWWWTHPVTYVVTLPQAMPDTAVLCTKS